VLNIEFYCFYRRGRPFSPDSPKKKLCISIKKKKKCWESDNESPSEDENDVDVTELEPEIPIPYDPTKARNLMTRCEKHSKIMKPVDASEKWESQIIRFLNLVKFDGFTFTRWVMSRRSKT